MSSKVLIGTCLKCGVGLTKTLAEAEATPQLTAVVGTQLGHWFGGECSRGHHNPFHLSPLYPSHFLLKMLHHHFTFKKKLTKAFCLQPPSPTTQSNHSKETFEQTRSPCPLSLFHWLCRQRGDWAFDFYLILSYILTVDYCVIDLLV